MAVKRISFSSMGLPGRSTSKNRPTSTFYLSVLARPILPTYGNWRLLAWRQKAGRADLSHLTIMKVLDKTFHYPIQPLVCSGDILQKVIVLYDKPIGTSQADLLSRLSAGPP